MSTFAFGSMLFSVMLILIGLRVPVGVAMLFVGGVGFIDIAGWTPFINMLKTSTYGFFSSYTLSVVPLFILMGYFATEAGMSAALFRAARAWFGHLRGGLAIATIGGCAAFGAICGSSVATVATMTKVALPEMMKSGYSRQLTAGTLAAGGTLGILIPPSVVLVIYAIYAEQSIGRLFLATIIPGLVATMAFMFVIALYVRLAPGSGPTVPRASAAARAQCVGETWPAAVVFLTVVGGIYAGWFDPTEGAAVGAGAIGLFAVGMGGMRWKGLVACLLSTAESTALIFLILLGAQVFNAFLALTQMPADLAQLVVDLKVSPLAVLTIILIFYLILGCIMDSMAMVLLTLPVVLPIMQVLDLGLNPEQLMIWFGILVLMVVEVGLITPPFGLNIFVIAGMTPDLAIHDVYHGVWPFVIINVFVVVLIVLFPEICLIPAGLMPLRW